MKLDKLSLVASLAVAAVVTAACSSSSSSSATPVASPVTSGGATLAQSAIGSGSLPGQSNMEVPVFPSYYDAHKDIVMVTDAYPKAAATQYHANYAPDLKSVNPSSQPLWYVIKGNAAPGQITVLGSEPGESDYSPLWQTVNVAWKSGVTPVLLTSDNMINDLAKKGELTETVTPFVVNATVLTVGK
jgi:hypothetical protein